MKKKTLLRELLTEGIRSRIEQNTGRQRANGALQVIARALYNAEPREFDDYANLMLVNFENHFEPIMRQWDRLSNKSASFEKLFRKLGIQPKDQKDLERALAFFARQYNERYNHWLNIETSDNVEDWWGNISVQIDDLYMLHRAEADDEDRADYLRDHVRESVTFIQHLTEGIQSRTSQTDQRRVSAIDVIARALAYNTYSPRSKIIPPYPQEIIGAFEQALDAIADKIYKGQKIDFDLRDYADHFGVTEKYNEPFRKAFSFIAQDYMKYYSRAESNSLSHHDFVAAVDAASDWFNDITNQIEKKYKAYRPHGISEGITARTSQHDKRTEAAIDVIGKALSTTFRHAHPRPREKRLDNFEDTLVTLAAFLQVPDDHYGGSLDWFFKNRFDELRINPKDRPPYSSHVQNALIYLAQRYNQLETDDDAYVQDWYYDIVDKIEAKMNEGSPKS